MIRYDVIRYDIIGLFTFDQKLTRWPASNARHRNEKIRKTKNKYRVRSSPEETVRAKVREGSPGGRSETIGGRICETSRF